MTVVEVEVDIFSGMPNPTWTLGEADATTFFSEFAKLRKTGAKPRTEKLGYRGLIVRTRQKLNEEIHIQNGVVELRDEKGSTFFLDRNHSLERWLLETGTLSDDVVKAIDLELND